MRCGSWPRCGQQQCNRLPAAPQFLPAPFALRSLCTQGHAQTRCNPAPSLPLPQGELQAALQERGLSTEGGKNGLADRLHAALLEEQKAAPQAAPPAEPKAAAAKATKPAAAADAAATPASPAAAAPAAAGGAQQPAGVELPFKAGEQPDFDNLASLTKASTR